ncbi:hypothetical protein D3P07_15705 [Paenibacillus sp. 1011MAR3C5]|uniref:YxlC family protein n=1 Tax=Paenibacillus sp. 1011MAR3C5 TaxID=1675787 RepID=UPI000E6CF976|nr:YxlC family protein [Paenibacillus sp. 1011MAR3C5]RJE87745.1 hypothetical protein D3P07_15705 [Paenibacillus sp. 1011MAR3C5]
MKKNKVHDEDQQWFMEHIGTELRKMDDAYERSEPELGPFESFVASHKQALRRKLWRDLALFWLVAAMLLLGMLWILERDWIWFAALQLLVAISAISYIGFVHVWKGRKQWKNN